MPSAVVIVGAILLVILLLGFLIPRSRDHFLKEWMPSVITGLVLIGLVPYANEVYWKRQRETEMCIQDREKRYELLGSVTRTYTHLFKIHTRLDTLQEEQQREVRGLKKSAARGKLAKEILEAHRAHLSALTSERSELIKELARLQGQLAADQALIARVYSREVWAEYAQVAGQYDKRVSEQLPFKPTSDDPVVKAAFALAHKMAEEMTKYENQCK